MMKLFSYERALATTGNGMRLVIMRIRVRIPVLDTIEEFFTLILKLFEVDKKYKIRVWRRSMFLRGVKTKLKVWKWKSKSEAER